jgi:hypothetical protein
MPSALAVLRLMTKANLLACSTGRSPGFAPRKSRRCMRSPENTPGAVPKRSTLPRGREQENYSEPLVMGSGRMSERGHELRLRQPGSVRPTSADVLAAERCSAQGQATFGKALAIPPSQRVCAFGLRRLLRDAAPKAVYLMNGMQQRANICPSKRGRCLFQSVARRSVLVAGCSRPNKGRGFTTVALVTSGRGVDILQWIRESRRASGSEEGKKLHHGFS